MYHRDNTFRTFREATPVDGGNAPIFPHSSSLISASFVKKRKGVRTMYPLCILARSGNAVSLYTVRP
jgi:hypothetical protein